MDINEAVTVEIRIGTYSGYTILSRAELKEIHIQTRKERFTELELAQWIDRQIRTASKGVNI